MIPRSSDEDAYTINHAIDKAVYGIGRGYDSTVWRKTYSADGKAKYVNIADLNSVVPTFAVTGDAPTDFPQVPHYDKDSTNVYYNLHLQTPWGFRIANIDDSKSAVKDILNKSDANIIADDIKYDANGHYIDIDINKQNYYKGAIYFNKSGFNIEKSAHSDFTWDQNEIRIDNYASGRLYNNRGGFALTKDTERKSGKKYYKKINNTFVETETSF